MAKVKCTICGAYLPEGTEECPVCGVSSEMFEPVGMVKCTFCGAVFEEGVDTCPICCVGQEYFEPATEEDVASRLQPVSSGDGKMVKCLVCGAEFEEGAAACPVCGVGPENFIAAEKKETSFSKDTDETFVILGGGPAAKSAAEAIRTRNQTAVITIVTQESHLPYNRPMLTKGIVRDFGYNGLVMEGPEWYEKNNINFVPDTVVLKADTVAKTVSIRCADGSEGQIKYDKLIYALGAYCFVPLIKGADLDHVVSVRSIADTDRVKQIISDRGAARAVCIGGGVMGLEGAWGLKEGGLDVTVLETAPGLLPRQLDDTASEMLKELCIEAGVDIVTGAKIAEITENAVVLDDGTEYEAQLVIMSTGMRPYTKVAEDSGIAVDKWVTAGSDMKTNIPDVYTAGDCCSVNGQPQAFWAQAVETGRIAGANAAGDKLEYKPIGSSLVMEVCGTSVFALGTNGKDPDRKFRSEQIKDDVKKTYSKYYYDHGKLVGAILIGDISGMSAAISKMKS
jgi:NAD(P)H-nitrite reductase large subunit/RNA polymerase subunit RPABC4/transcription elongation factor Spt4